MRTNSGAGESKNNNHDPTLRDHEGKKGPAQRSAVIEHLDKEEDRATRGPSDSRRPTK